MPKEIRKFIFDQPYNGAVGFDSRDCVFIQDPILSSQGIDPKISQFQQSKRSTNAMQVFKDLFEMDDFELLCRMDENKIMKTLKFINDNVKENNLFCLATFSTHGEQYYPTKSSFRKHSEVIFGQILIFVIENALISSYFKDIKAINSLLEGIVPAEFSKKNVTILINYKHICKKNIDEAANFFKYDLKQQNTPAIPLFVIFNCNDPVKEIKFENSYLFPSLKFAINIILENFYQNKIMPVNSECQKTLMDLLLDVCFKTKKLSNQGPFHKWKNDITKYMEDLMQLKHQLKRIYCDNGNQNIASVYHCLELLQELIKRDFIPYQHSWILVDYNDLHGQDKSILLLRRECAKKWEKQLVFSSEDWIAPLKKFCGDEEELTSKKENVTLKDNVWLYDKDDKSSNEPYLIIHNEKFTIGICEEILESSWICEHLNDKQKIQHFCVKCKKNVEIKNKILTCYCGVKVNLKKQCLSCWRIDLSTSIDKNSELNLKKTSGKKWICLDCKESVEQQNGYFICNCVQKQCLICQKSNLGTSIKQNDEKTEASRKLAKWTEAMKTKEPFIKPEQKAAYDHALECLKFMTKKHGSTLNTSELTTDIQQLTKQEFTDAIDNFVKTCENSGKLLQKCKEIVEFFECE